MPIAAALAALSGLLGGAIALLARQRPAVLERTRTFAFAAAAGVVAFHLLPEILPEQGPTALLYVAAGFALPWLLESAARLVGPRLFDGRGFVGARVAAEVGFVALLFHSVVEGLALVAALARPSGKLDLEIALVAHHAPLTAAVTLPFLELKGPRSVALRAVLVGLAGLCGVLASGAFPGFTEGALLQKATAVTAGVLLHVVADEIRAQRFASQWERAADLAACAAGLLVAGLGAVLHLRESPAAGPLQDFLRVQLGLSLVVAPAFLLGALADPLCARVPGLHRLRRLDAVALAGLLLGPLAALLVALAAIASQPAPVTPASPGPRREFLAALRQRTPALLPFLVLAAGLEVTSSPLPPSWPLALALLAGVVLAARLDLAGAVLLAGVLAHQGLRLAALLPGLPESRLGRLHDDLLAQAAQSPLGALALTVVALLALATIWSLGVRGWFAPLRHRPEGH